MPFGSDGYTLRGGQFDDVRGLRPKIDAAVLRRFSERDAIYLTDWARVRFEAPARENLRRALARWR